jgi:hypothetical protein
VQLDRKRWLYGFEEARDEFANKAAGKLSFCSVIDPDFADMVRAACWRRQ